MSREEWGNVRSLAGFLTTSPTGSHCTSCAFAENLCLFFALPQRIGEEKALRGPIPLRTPQRTNVAALSLRSCLREVLHLQILRRCFKEKHRHGRRTRQAKEKVFAICDEPYFNIIYQQTGGASPSPTKTARIFAFSACRAWCKMARDE